MTKKLTEKRSLQAVIGVISDKLDALSTEDQERTLQGVALALDIVSPVPDLPDAKDPAMQTQRPQALHAVIGVISDAVDDLTQAEQERALQGVAFALGIASPISKPHSSATFHPMQQLLWTGDVVRFRENQIVRWILEQGEAGNRFDLNAIASRDFSAADCAQFWQQLGYSVGGYGELSFIPRKIVHAADRIANELQAKAKRSRNE